MKKNDLLSQITLGEDSTRQFKLDVKNGDSLASEMAGFANSEGGTIYIGVADDGSIPGVIPPGRGADQSAYQQCGQSFGSQSSDRTD